MVLSDLTTILSILLVAFLLLIFMIKVIKTHGKSAQTPPPSKDKDDSAPSV